jgi:hypothetical protein
MSPWREVPQPEKVPSYHLSPERGALSAGTAPAAPLDAAALGAVGGGAVGAAAGAVTTGALAVAGSVATGELAAGSGARVAVPVAAADTSMSAARDDVGVELVRASDSGATSLCAGDAMFTLGDRLASFTPGAFSETSGATGMSGASAAFAGDGDGGRLRPLLRTASASAASLVRL